MYYRLRSTLLASLALATVVPSAVQAKSLCESLSLRLSRLSTEVISNTDSLPKYAIAIQNQKTLLKNTRSDMRKMSCSSGSITIIGGANSADCEKYGKAVVRMEQNLEDLQAKYDSAATGQRDSKARNRILAAIEANGCDATQPALTIAATPSDSPIEEIVRPLPAEGNGIIVNSFGDGSTQAYRVESLGSASMNGSLRTLCVRTCDGAFFPISSAASTDSFARDARVCSMMCPGTKTELYYHSIYGQESQDMVSTATGQPYADLPQAYAFRTLTKDQRQGCGCNFSAYYAEMSRREKALGAASQTPAAAAIDVSTMKLKPALALNDDKIIGSAIAKTAPVDYDPSSRRIRIIGPSYLPDENSALDLKHPKVTTTSTDEVSQLEADQR